MSSVTPINLMTEQLKLAPMYTEPDSKITDPSFAKQLEKAQNSGDQKKLQEACHGLESVLIQHMIKSMRATVPKTDFLGKSMALNIYEQMLDEKYAEEMAKSQTFGLASMLYQQLSEKLTPATEEPASTSPIK